MNIDAKVSTKETRLQPEGLVDVYVPNVFDFYLIESDDGYIENCELLGSKEAVQQEALFASIKQRGNDPLSLEEGVRWAECALGEVPIELVMADIKNEVTSVSTDCSVTFDTVIMNGNETMSFQIQVLQGRG